MVHDDLKRFHGMGGELEGIEEINNFKSILNDFNETENDGFLIIPVFLD